MTKIKTTWTYRNLQLIIIFGLVLGIYIESQGGVNAFIPPAKAELTYQKEETICDLDCEILRKTHEIYEDKKDENMEEARLEALVQMRDVLLEKIDNSPYVDYQAMQQKYGY